MSIIEKAMDKLGGQRKGPLNPVPHTDLERSEPSLEPASETHAHGLSADPTPVSPQDVETEKSAGLQHIDGAAEHSFSREMEEAGSVFSEDQVPHGKDETPSTIHIDFDGLSEKGMVSPLSPRSQVAEEFRAIKRPLLMNISANYAGQIQHPNLIMVTSALQGDGKTFSAINLALSIAMEQDKTVLFVDADVSKATAGRVLGVPESHAGLIDLLDGKVRNASDVILNTNVQNLRIIPSGNIHDRATELLASDAMHELMLELSGRYRDRVILFDSPPLLLTSEAGVLANFMGQIVFVVAADETPAGAVTEALVKIGKDKAVGMLLNKAKRASFMFGGKYGYGYGYGYGGYGYGRSSASESKGD